MKCSACGTSQKYKDGMTCQKCQTEYVFDPKNEKPKITDGRFSKMVKKASAEETHFFTMPQLVAASRPGPLNLIAPALLLLFLLIAFLFFSVLRAPLLLYIIFGTVFGSFFLAAIWPKKMPYTLEEIEGFVARWEAKRGPLPKLLRQPRLSSPPPSWDVEDAYDYGVEKIVIVERDILVDWLVLNNWHAENRALVLAESGYPSYLLPKAKALLDENPRMRIFLAHDATPHGAKMKWRILENPTLGLEAYRERMIVLGLTHEDTKKIKKLKAYHRTPAYQTAGLSLDVLPFGLVIAFLGACIGAGRPASELLEGGAASGVEGGAASGVEGGAAGGVEGGAAGDFGAGDLATGDFG